LCNGGYMPGIKIGQNAKQREASALWVYSSVSGGNAASDPKSQPLGADMYRAQSMKGKTKIRKKHRATSETRRRLEGGNEGKKRKKGLCFCCRQQRQTRGFLLLVEVGWGRRRRRCPLRVSLYRSNFSSLNVDAKAQEGPNTGR